MANADQRLSFITDRAPGDPDPSSVWMWREILDLAQSGKTVQVHFLSPSKSISSDYHHPRIHVLPGYALSPRALATWRPQQIHLIEPQIPSFASGLHFSSLAIFILGLKQSGTLNSDLSATFFSAKPMRIPFATKVFYSHPQFPKNFFPSYVSLEPIDFQTSSAPPEGHWSLEHLEQSVVVPGSLSEVDLSDPSFLNATHHFLAQKPWAKFLFLKGLGSANIKQSKLFLQSDLGAHFQFPEGLNGDQMLYALSRAGEIWTAHVDPTSALMGAALKLKASKQNFRLESKSVYGIL